MNGKFLVILGIIAIGIIAGWYWYSIKQTQLYEFAGNIVQVKDNSIIVEGDIVPSATDSEALFRMEAFVGPDTKITRVALRLPSEKELDQLPNGMYRPEDLPREESAVTLDTLRSNLQTNLAGVTIRSDENIADRDSFRAVEIIYTIGTVPAQ